MITIKIEGRRSRLEICSKMAMYNTVGVALNTPSIRKAVAEFADKNKSAVVADVRNGLVCDAISSALESRDCSGCLLCDMAGRLNGRFLVLFGVDPTNAEMLQTIRVVKAQSDCQVLAVLECDDCETAMIKLYAMMLEDGVRNG